MGNGDAKEPNSKVNLRVAWMDSCSVEIPHSNWCVKFPLCGAIHVPHFPQRVGLICNCCIGVFLLFFNKFKLLLLK
jgi:hypothetical protein